ncbi:MAG TPA: hypothetical protein VEB60_00465 [Candidatus Paceibacterota bacterium]|nr:hypothetical protein [Candidatus Paceibacterota bacterium]
MAEKLQTVCQHYRLAELLLAQGARPGVIYLATISNVRQDKVNGSPALFYCEARLESFWNQSQASGTTICVDSKKTVVDDSDILKGLDPESDLILLENVYLMIDTKDNQAKITLAHHMETLASDTLDSDEMAQFGLEAKPSGQLPLFSPPPTLAHPA